jgi:hypothetical protein
MNEEKPQTAVKVSSALDFKKKREQSDKTETIKLDASGLFVEVKRPRLKMLISTGMIPDSVASLMLNSDPTALKPKDLPKLIEMQRIVTMHTIVSPKVVEGAANYDAGEISIDDLEDGDVNTVWAWYNGGNEGIESFRSQREGLATRLNKSSISEPITE